MTPDAPVLDTASNAGVIDLGHALRAGWIEFWYQPKVDLRSRRMVGVEMLARARHPFHGVLSAGVFLGGADDSSLAHLSSYAIQSALHGSRTLAREGARLPITVNVPTCALDVPFIDRMLGHQNADWAGLIFDVPRQDMFGDPARFARLAADLAARRIRLAADDFGGNLCAVIRSGDLAALQQQIDGLSALLKQLKAVSIVELKLDRSLAVDCAADPQRAAMCKLVIDLIHHLGATAVAVGLEKHADVATLQELGCDVAQGNVFGAPASLDTLVASLKGRAGKAGR